MSDEERRTLIVTTTVLLLASLVRFAWEARPVPPILPPAPVPEQLIAETQEAVDREERMNTPLAPGERIDPNRDPYVELARLPGVGPALAERIVESREREGVFLGADDLLRVSGIGPATLERMRPHLELSARSPVRSSAASPALPGGSEARVDLNRASPDELLSLPGVGPALSARIVEWRRENGRFRSIDDLARVRGIGPATIERFRNLVRVGP